MGRMIALATFNSNPRAAQRELPLDYRAGLRDFSRRYRLFFSQGQRPRASAPSNSICEEIKNSPPNRSIPFPTR